MVEAHNRAVEERRAKLRGRGFTDEQIDAIDDEFDRLRKILEEWKIEMEPAVTEVLRKVFREMHRCCQGTDPKQEYLDAMSTAVRWAALRGVSPLEEDEMGKMSECGCRIASHRPGAPEGFVGTISFEERARGVNGVSAKCVAAVASFGAGVRSVTAGDSRQCKGWQTHLSGTDPGSHQQAPSDHIGVHILSVRH